MLSYDTKNAATPVTQGGRIVLPAALRKQLNIAVGDEVTLTLVDGGILVRPRHASLLEVRDRLAAYLPRDVSLADQLIAARRAEAARE